MSLSQLENEFIALRDRMVSEDFAALARLGVPDELTRTFAVVAVGRGVFDGELWRPDEDGRRLVVIAVRGESGIELEFPLPDALIRCGAEILDLVAIAPRENRWATRFGAACHLGYVPPQFADPAPTRIHRSPIGWLRAGGQGLCLLTRRPAEQQDLLLRLRALIGEDIEHGEELQALVSRPLSGPCVFVAQSAAA